MKTKFFSLIGIGMIAMFFLVSCKDEPSSSSKLTFKGVNLNNAKALALVQEGNSAKAPGRSKTAYAEERPQTKFLYTVDEEGNMNAAIFYFNEVDSTTNTKALRLSIENIFAVGDDYLWLYGCQYDCDDIDALPSKARKYVQEQIDASRTRTGHYNYLIRKTDGALFNLTDITVLPLNWEGKIEVANRELTTSNDFKKYGIVAQVGKELYWAIGNYQGGLRKLVDQGSTMDQVNLDYHANIAYILGDGNGHLGTVLSYTSNIPTSPAFINGNNANLVQGLPEKVENNSPCMHYIGGKYFVSGGTTIYYPEEGKTVVDGGIYSVSFENGTPTATLCVEGGKLPDYTQTYEESIYPVYVESSVYSWLQNSTIFTFDTEKNTCTQEKLPDGFPASGIDYDEEGNCYQAEGKELTSIKVYNLPTRSLSTKTVDRSNVPAHNYSYGAEYDMALKAFLETIILSDGSTATLITPVTGENAFRTVVMGTESSGTAVVATVVQLN